MTPASLKRIIAGMVAAVDDVNYRPNPNGSFPCCKPRLGGTTCERCGGDVSYRGPCPAVSPEHRWGPDWIPGEAHP